MAFTINTKKEIPSEKETKIKILSIAMARNCLQEVKQLYKKYDDLYRKYQFEEKAKFDLAKSFIFELSEIDIYLVAWLCDESGNIVINNVVAFTLVDVPDEKL